MVTKLPNLDNFRHLNASNLVDVFWGLKSLQSGDKKYSPTKSRKDTDIIITEITDVRKTHLE